MATFPIVLAITAATLLLLFLTIPARNAGLRVSITGEGKCGPITLRTTALYFEHTGDEDKPIDPLIIATSPPGKEEIQCAVPRAATLLNRNVPTHEPDPHADFQYVLVSKSGRVQIGPFSDGEAIKLFEDLAQYFQKRQPDLQEKLTNLIRRLGGPQQLL